MRSLSSENVKCVHSHDFTQVGDHSLWPIPAELVTVLPLYTKVVGGVISETRGSYQRK